jgi:hypothetical protein
MISCDKLPSIFYETVAKELTQVICDTLYNPGTGPSEDNAKRDPRREILTLVDKFVNRALNDITQKQITDSFTRSFNDVVSQNMQVFFSDQYISMYMMKTLLDEERVGTNSRGETFKKMLQIITSSGIKLYEPKSGDDIQSKKTESIMGQLSIIPVKKDEASKDQTNMSGGVEFTDVLSSVARVVSDATSGLGSSASLQAQSANATKLGNSIGTAAAGAAGALGSLGKYIRGSKSNKTSPASEPDTSNETSPEIVSTASNKTSPTSGPIVSNKTSPTSGHIVSNETSPASQSTTSNEKIPTSNYSTAGSIAASKLGDKGQGLFTSAIKTVFGPVIQKISGEIVEMIEKDLSLKEYFPQQISDDIYNLVKDALQFHLAQPEGRQMFLRQIEPLLKRYVFTYTSSSSDLLTLSVLRHLCTTDPMKSLLENTIKKHIDLYNDGQPNDYIETVYKNLYSAINERLIEQNPIITMYETMQTMFTSGQIGKKIIYDYDDNESLYKNPFYTSKNDILSKLKISEEIPTIVGDAGPPPLVQQKSIETDSNTADSTLTKKTGGKSKRVSKTKRRRRTFRKQNTTQRHL